MNAGKSILSLRSQKTFQPAVDIFDIRGIPFFSSPFNTPLHECEQY